MCIYAQDGIGGYYLYNFPCSEEMAAQLVAGTKIRVYDYKSEWAGEIEIVADDLDPDYSRIEIIEGNYVAEPAYVTDLLGKERQNRKHTKSTSSAFKQWQSCCYKKNTKYALGIALGCITLPYVSDFLVLWLCCDT